MANLGYQRLDLLLRHRTAGSALDTTVTFIGDQFPAPSEKHLGCDNCRQFRKHLSSDQPDFGCQTATLVIGKAQPAAAQLGTEDSVLLAKYWIAYCCS